MLLLIDNFSGHKLAVRLVSGEQGLSHVRIAWLPPNTTSEWHPIDQGIITSFKLQYRKLWVTFMLREYNAAKNPQKTVNLLKAIQQTRTAQETAVTQTTIQRCQYKSTLIKRLEEPIAEDNQVTEQAELHACITQLQLDNPLSLIEFLALDNKVVKDEDDDTFASVVEH